MKESGENYLETIYLLSSRQTEVHAVDIAKELNFSKPSITRALSILKTKGFITMDEANHIFLTHEGREKAQKIYERHTALTDFLIKLGVSEKNADQDACRIEHVICEETLDRIKRFNKETKA